MKILLGLVLLGMGITAQAIPAHKVTGTAVEFEYEELSGHQAIADMNRRARLLCEEFGGVQAQRVSDITLSTKYHQFGYGRMTVSATAMFICD